MSALPRLLARLHSVFNKEPEAAAVIAFTPPAGGTIAVAVPTVTLSTGETIDLTDQTLADLVSAIDAVAGWSASLSVAAKSGWLAHAVLDGGIFEGVLFTPDSPLWHELGVIGFALDEQAARIVLASEQLYPDTATGAWADLWGRDFFGVPRAAGEADTAYTQRMIYEAVRTVANNRSLEIILEGALPIYSAAVADAVTMASTPPGVWKYGDGYPYGFTGMTYGGESLVTQPAAEVRGYFTVDLRVPLATTAPEAAAIAATAAALVSRHRAAGTKLLTLTTTGVEGEPITDEAGASITDGAGASITETT